MVFKEILLNQLIWSSKEFYGLEEGSEAEKEDWVTFAGWVLQGADLEVELSV